MNYADLVFNWDPKKEVPEALVSQLEKLDFELIEQLVHEKQSQIDWSELASRALPPSAFRVKGENRFTKDEAITKGVELLSEGKVAMILVAGGQGTRLGFVQPKGMFPIGPVSNRTLFEVFVDQIKAIGSHFNVKVPLYVMTSPATHDATVAHFSENDSFGLPEDELTIFCQGTMPAVDRETGKVLLAAEDEIALSPNRHGGMFDALAESGCLQSAIDRGVEYFFYGQIDNPLAQVCDPALMGYHALSKSEMTTQVVTKAHALEKVGNVVEIDGQVQIIEYSDLPEEFALKTDDNGQPLLWAGNIAVHVFSASFLSEASQNTSSLPFHLAFKKVPFVDGNAGVTNPDSPNAIKFEKFIFDLLPQAKNAIVVEVEKSEGFAPVKNADGAPADTPSLARKAISDLHKRWIRSCGTQVPDNVQVEIHPGFALNAEQLSKCELPESIAEDTYFAS